MILLSVSEDQRSNMYSTLDLVEKFLNKTAGCTSLHSLDERVSHWYSTFHLYSNWGENNRFYILFWDKYSGCLELKKKEGRWGHKDKGLYEKEWKLCVPGMTDAASWLAGSCTDGIRCQQVPISPIRVEGNSTERILCATICEAGGKNKTQSAALFSQPAGVYGGKLILDSDSSYRGSVDSPRSAELHCCSLLMSPLM